MSKLLLLLSLLTYLYGCTSSNMQAQLPDFETPNSVIADARSAFRASNYDALFLLMTDRNGKVVKVRVIEHSNDLNDDTLRHLRGSFYTAVRYKPAQDNQPNYREFFYPVKLGSANWI